MAKIPGAESIQVRLPGSVEQTPFRRDVSAEGAPAAAGAKVLGEMQQIQQQQYEINARNEYAEAKVNFQIGKIKQDSAYDQDDDEDTIMERYEGGVNESLGQAAAGITDGNLRNQFVNEGRLAVEQGKIRMAGVVHKKKGDKKIAFMNEATGLIHKGAIEGGDMPAAQDSIASMWESMAEQGYVSHTDAQKAIEKSKYTMALGRLKTMDPESQLEALKEPWVTDLPLDVRVQLKNEAEAEMLDDQALITANKWAQEGLTVDQINAELANITDPDLYDRVRVRAFQMKNDEEAGLQEMQSDLYNEYFADVALNGLPIDDIPDLDKYGMNSAQISNLQAAEARAAAKKAGQYVRSYSDPEIKGQLRGMLARGEIQKGKTYFSENFAGLNDADYKYFETQFNPVASKDPRAKGLRTLNQTMKRLLDDNGLSEDSAAEVKIWDNLEDRFDQYVDSKGKRPTDREIQEWAKDEFLTIRRDPDAWFMNNDDYLYNMQPTEREDFFEAADILRNSYPGIGREQIIERYENMLRERNNAAE